MRLRGLTQPIYLVKYIPEWFPGAEFKRRAREGSEIAKTVLNVPYMQAKKKYVRNATLISVTPVLIEVISWKA